MNIPRQWRVACVCGLIVAIVAQQYWASQREPVSHNAEGCQLTINPSHTGAVERVRSYITDAYAWEAKAMPPDPSLMEAMRERMWEKNLSAKAGGSHPSDPSISDRLKARGRALLQSRKEHMRGFERVAATHWVGDDWKSEVAVLSCPSKHDPSKEVVTGTESCSDGTVNVMTTLDPGSRTPEERLYHVECEAGEWRIRTCRYLGGSS